MSRTLGEIRADKQLLHREADILNAKQVGLKAHLDTFCDERESPQKFQESKDVALRINEINKALKDLHQEEIDRLGEHKSGPHKGTHHRKGG